MTSPKPRSGNSILRRTLTSKLISVALCLRMLTTPRSYFAEIEQAAFTPSHTVDGWAPSADPVLQARLFSYSGTLCPYYTLRDQYAQIGVHHFSLDTHRYRLGVNHMVGYPNGGVRPTLSLTTSRLANPGQCAHQRSRQLPARRCYERQWESGVAPKLPLNSAEDPATRTAVRRRHAPAVDRESSRSSKDLFPSSREI